MAWAYPDDVAPTPPGWETADMHSWWLDERAHAGAEHLDPGTSPATSARRATTRPPTSSALLAHGIDGRLGRRRPRRRHRRVHRGDRPALRTRRRRRRLAGDDRRAADRVEREGLANVTVVEAGFLSYDHEGPPADAVFTRNALHQLPDFWKVLALARIADMLRPGGVLRLHDLVYDFEPDEADRRIEEWMSGAVDDPAVGYTAEELATHLRTEFSTFSWLFEPMLERAGFTILDRQYVRGAYGAYTCRR